MEDKQQQQQQTQNAPQKPQAAAPGQATGLPP
jgi:hypothetical protein